MTAYCRAPEHFAELQASSHMDTYPGMAAFENKVAARPSCKVDPAVKFSRHLSVS